MILMGREKAKVCRFASDIFCCYWWRHGILIAFSHNNTWEKISEREKCQGRLICGTNGTFLLEIKTALNAIHFTFLKRRISASFELKLLFEICRKLNKRQLMQSLVVYYYGLIKH